MATQTTTTTTLTTTRSDEFASAHLKPFGALEPVLASSPWAVFPRIRIDVSYSDIFGSLAKCLTAGESERAEYEQKITQLWDPTGHSMLTFSVRTGFDLLLQSLNLPEGSEIVCAAITIQNMMDIMHYHKLVPVPVDLIPETLAVDAKALRAAITPKTKAIILTHIYGTRNSMDDVMDLAEKLNLPVIEDCAQAFVGLGYTGHPRAFASMFSFGGIKISTAFGGGLIRVKDLNVLNQMKEREAKYEIRSNGFFAKRLVKYSAIFTLFSPSTFGVFVNTCRLFGADHGQIVVNATRGFLGGDLMSLIRFRPALPMLPLLLERLSNFDQANMNLRKHNAAILTKLIEKMPNVQVPGIKAESHHFWLYPVLVESPDEVVKYMHARGFDAHAGHKHLPYVPSPLGPEHDPKFAKYMISRTVYLPLCAEMPEWSIIRMAQVFQEAVESTHRRIE